MNFVQFDSLNSELVEQYHAALDRSDLTGSVAHMSQTNFLQTLRFQMFLHNMKSDMKTLKLEGVSLQYLIERVQMELRLQLE